VASQHLDGILKDDNVVLKTDEQTVSDKEKENMQDCFHDETKLLPLIGDWINHLKNESRKCDPFTSKVLEIATKNLLLEVPSQRANFSQLCTLWEETRTLALKEYNSKSMSFQLHPVDDRVEEILLAVEMVLRDIKKDPSLAEAGYAKVRIGSNEILIPLLVMWSSKRIQKAETIKNSVMKLTTSRMEASEKLVEGKLTFFETRDTRRKSSITSMRPSVSHASTFNTTREEDHEGISDGLRLSPRLNAPRFTWSNQVLTTSPVASPIGPPDLPPMSKDNGPKSQSTEGTLFVTKKLTLKASPVSLSNTLKPAIRDSKHAKTEVEPTSKYRARLLIHEVHMLINV